MKRSSYWYVRLLTRHGIRPLFAGLATFAALLLIFITWVAIAVWLDEAVDLSIPRLIVEVLFIALVSYCLGATAHTLEASSDDVSALAPAMALDEENLAREAASIREQNSAIHIWTLAWIIAAIVLTWWASRVSVSDDFFVGAQTGTAGWTYFRNLMYVFTLSQLTWIDIALARRLGKLLERYGRINLLDRSALQPLAQRTRRSVLTWVPLLAHSILFIVVVLTVVILPAAGIRRRYIEEKDRQLGQVRTRIADRSAAVIDGNLTSESTGLPELVSWEQRLQQVNVWPYDMTMYSRVFLYAAIGLSSWIGAALVERFVDAFFG